MDVAASSRRCWTSRAAVDAQPRKVHRIAKSLPGRRRGAHCVANGKVLRDGHFDNVWIQPAAGDAGGAVGAALSAYHGFMESRAKPTARRHAARTWDPASRRRYRNKIDRCRRQVHRAR